MMNTNRIARMTRAAALASSMLAVGIGATACGGEAPKATPTPTHTEHPATPTATSIPTPAAALLLTDVWARATPGLPDENSAVYASIENPNAKADRIVAASVASTVAKRVELHTTVQENGMMQMKPVEGYDVASKGTLKLQPGGNHIMLLGLAKQLNVGDTFTITLKLQSGATVESKVEVKTPPAGAMPGGMTPGGAMPGGAMPGGSTMPPATSTPAPRSQAPVAPVATRAAPFQESC